jgi:hypothetical protein
MKNLKKQTKFKLEHFEVAKLNSAKKIIGGSIVAATGGDDATTHGTGAGSGKPGCRIP